MVRYILCLEIWLMNSLNPFVMGSHSSHETAIRYRGFLLLRQPNQSWLVRPERSPMLLLPFRTPTCSITEVKKILDKRLIEESNINQLKAA